MIFCDKNLVEQADLCFYVANYITILAQFQIFTILLGILRLKVLFEFFLLNFVIIDFLFLIKRWIFSHQYYNAFQGASSNFCFSLFSF